jgi:thioredoxin-related protein
MKILLEHNMLKLNRCLIAAIIAGSIAPLARAASEEGYSWQTDFEAAKAKAKAEKKLLLVDFTGSDWCVWCKKLRSEVFDKEEFQTAAPKKFVLVELDFPAGKKLPDELKAQNEKLRSEYKIHGYPTVLLLDAEGKLVAHTGYKPGGPEKYVEQLDGFLDTYASSLKMKEGLAKTKGLDRAKLLDKLVEANDKLANDSEESAGWSKEIVALDANNKAGLKNKHEFRMLLAESKQAAENKKFADAKTAIDKALALKGISPKQKNEAYMFQCQLCFNQKDIAGVLKCLEQAVDAAPDSPEAAQAKAMIARFKPMAEAQEAMTKLKGQLEKSEGLDRAKLLDKLVDAQTRLLMFNSGEGVRQIEKWSEEIVSLDADNKAGLKSKYEILTTMSQARMQLARGNLDKARSLLNKAAALPGLSDNQKETIEQARKSIEIAQARKRLPKEKEGGEEK